MPGFQPFETHLDRERALSILQDATAGAEDGEIFLERRRSESLSFDDGRLRTASSNSAEGFGLRTVLGGAAGYAHSTDISEESLKRAAETSRMAARQGGGVLADPPAGTNQQLYAPVDPVGDVETAAKIALLAEIDAYLRARDPRIVQVSASISGSVQEIEILRPEGRHVTDHRPLARLGISVIVEQGGRRESGSTGGGGRHGLGELMDPANWRAQADEALRIALVNLDARDAPAGVMQVALGPGWPGILLHEAIGHGLEGDFHRKKTSAFTELMGEMIAAPGITVVDDGTIPDRRGSLSVDDEGTPTNRTVLIEDGRLVGLMQDRQNARPMGMGPTGNGRRERFAHIPMPRMTNTIMLAGEAGPAPRLAEGAAGRAATGVGGGPAEAAHWKLGIC